MLSMMVSHGDMSCALFPIQAPRDLMASPSAAMCSGLRAWLSLKDWGLARHARSQGLDIFGTEPAPGGLSILGQ